MGKRTKRLARDEKVPGGHDVRPTARNERGVLTYDGGWRCRHCGLKGKSDFGAFFHSTHTDSRARFEGVSATGMLRWTVGPKEEAP